MLTKVRIVNFKCLQDTGELDIRPLTLLVGPNSSGKSSLLQALLMLRQTADSTDRENPLTPNDSWVRLGSYPEFVYGQDWKGKLEVSLTFQEHIPKPKGEGQLAFSERESETLHLVASFHYNKKTTRILLDKAEIDQNQPEMRMRLLIPRNGSRYRLEVTTKEGGNPNILNVQLQKFYLLLPRPPARHSKKADELWRQTPPFWRAGFIIEAQLKGWFHLGPLREFPQRSYVISGQAPMDVGTRGERAAEVLWYAARTKERHRELLRQVNDWLRRVDIATEIRLERLGRSNQYQVLFVDPATGLQVNLADVGFGASQLLPIIVEGFYAPPDSLLLLEQPEIHLHPKAQAILGDLLIDMANLRDRRLIVETHSDHLLRRVQRRIAEGLIRRDEVAIYYFNPTQQGSQIREVTLNESGQFEEFPEGFLEEGLEEALTHLRAMQKRVAQGA